MAGVFMLFIGFAAVVWPNVAPRTPGETFLSRQGWIDRITGSIAVMPVIILVLAVLGSMLRRHRHPQRGSGHRCLRRFSPGFPLQLQAGMGAGAWKAAAKYRADWSL